MHGKFLIVLDLLVTTTSNDTLVSKGTLKRYFSPSSPEGLGEERERGGGGRERERERGGETDRQTDRKAGRQAVRQSGRQAEREKE